MSKTLLASKVYYAGSTLSLLAGPMLLALLMVTGTLQFSPIWESLDIDLDAPVSSSILLLFLLGLVLIIIISAWIGAVIWAIIFMVVCRSLFNRKEMVKLLYKTEDIDKELFDDSIHKSKILEFIRKTMGFPIIFALNMIYKS